MARIRIIPVLLLHNDGLVKSKKFKNYQYVGDPINAVRIFNDKEVDEIIVIDITATTQKKQPNIELIHQIGSEAFMPLGYGGGINSIKQIEQILHNGAEKIILNTACFNNLEIIKEAAKQFGSQSIVASIDVRTNFFGKYLVYRNNGKIKTDYDPFSLAKKLEQTGVGELFINSILRDGTYNGYDLKLIEQITTSVDIPVIACGGASNLNDFRNAALAGASALAAGSMFVFQRPHQAVLISYPTSKELKEKVYEAL